MNVPEWKTAVAAVVLTAVLDVCASTTIETASKLLTVADGTRLTTTNAPAARIITIVDGVLASPAQPAFITVPRLPV
jgi:hypothetical protein